MTDTSGNLHDPLGRFARRLQHEADTAQVLAPVSDTRVTAGSLEPGMLFWTSTHWARTTGKSVRVIDGAILLRHATSLNAFRTDKQVPVHAGE